VTLGDTVIVDYAETKITDRTERDVWELGGEILETLLAKTGIEKSEIDGLLVNAAGIGAGSSFWSQTTADYLGLELNFCQSVDIGGCSPTGAVVRAAAAIQAGLCHIALVLYADNGAPRTRRTRSYREEWTEPSGLLGPPGAFGLLTKRYGHLFGLKYEALGKIAVTQRDHAILNENACERLRKPITVDDYLNSRMIADPVRLLDCVMPCDGASGLIMMSRAAARARGYKRYAAVTGYGERTNFRANQSLVDVTETGHSVAAETAFAMAGLKPRDIGSFHPYDDFLFAVLLQFEMLGFCKRGQASDYILDTDFRFTGDLPLNTSGGQISAGQAGLAAGGTNLVEGIRQIFGEAGNRQVKNTANALVTGIGGIPYARNWWTSVVMILTAEG
jgi:acetyl-CoA acetyltransferase